MAVRSLAALARSPYDRPAMRRCASSTAYLLSRPFLFGLVIPFALAGGWGCSAHRQATEQKLRALEDQVDLLQGANVRLEERLGELELASRRSPQGSRPGASAVGPDRPPLEVLRLAPEQDAAAEGAAGVVPPPAAAPGGAVGGEDGGPRLLIRGTGDQVEASEPKPTSRIDPRVLGPGAPSPPLLHDGLVITPDSSDRMRRS